MTQFILLIAFVLMGFLLNFLNLGIWVNGIIIVLVGGIGSAIYSTWRDGAPLKDGVDNES